MIIREFLDRPVCASGERRGSPSSSSLDDDGDGDGRFGVIRGDNVTVKCEVDANPPVTRWVKVYVMLNISSKK